ncbi:MAG: carbon-nitrogen family hydrolase [Syntrophobacter sp.]
MRDVIAGCCQFQIKPADTEGNLAKVEQALLELADRNCSLAVLPEMWSCSFPYRVLRAMADKTPAIVEKIRKIAAQTGLVIIGSLPATGDGKIYNTSYVIDSTGGIAGMYRKVHLFTLYGEHNWFGRGESIRTFQTAIGRIGVMICYDLRFPELARKMALEGAEIICVSALWPLMRVEHWSLLLRARAVENQLFVIGTNGCGSEEKITWGGASAIISPWGEYIAAAGHQEQTIWGILGADEMDEFRRSIPCFDDRSPKAYEPTPRDDT